MQSIYQTLSRSAFGWLADMYIDNFKPLKHYLRGARIKVLLKTWVSMIFFTSLLVYFVSLAAVIAIGMFFEIFFLLYIVMVIFIPILAASFAFLIF
jgi:hypothetical protein